MTSVRNNHKDNLVASSRGGFVNTGMGPMLQPIDIGHPDYICIIDPDTAFWAIVKRDSLAEVISGGQLLKSYKKKVKIFADEMDALRFKLKPSAVYFNPTERCNLNCAYCYIPEDMRKNGSHMPKDMLFEALNRLKEYFTKTLPKGRMPQIVFHGAEPLLNRNAVFAGIQEFAKDFQFGIQTNASLLDKEAVDFLIRYNVSIGISLDAHDAKTADKTRKNWKGNGVYKDVVRAMEYLKGYDGWSVICTITKENMRHLTRLVEFFHRLEVPMCLLNIERCTLPSSRDIKPDDKTASKYFLSALDRTYELYLETGRKLPVVNFANILLSIIAPSARKLMCDISPCGGGRCFFALAPNGDLFPCSEFIGLKSFKGGNVFTDDIDDVLKSGAFSLVTGRKVEDIEPCKRCAIRHFCGSPCPAEAHEMNGGMEKIGAFCEFYEEQVRYAFRLIADNRYEAYFWDNWDKGTKNIFMSKN